MDSKIVKLIKKKKEKGIELLIDEYSPLILSIMKKHLYNYDLYSDECINDVYMAVWNNIGSFDSDKNSFKNWIAAITRYKSIDYNRKYSKSNNTVDISEITIKSDYDLENDALSEDIRNELEDLLKSLSESNKELFMRLYIEEDSIEDISRDLDVKPSVLYNRVYRAKNKLRKFIRI